MNYLKLTSNSQTVTRSDSTLHKLRFTRGAWHLTNTYFIQYVCLKLRVLSSNFQGSILVSEMEETTKQWKY